MTLDGKIAPPPDRRQSCASEVNSRGGWITGEAARAHVQELRHQSDAIWLEWEQCSPTIPCSPIAVDGRAAVLCCA